MKAPPHAQFALDRRAFIRTAASGTAIAALGGGIYLLSDDLTRKAQAEELADGRKRLPPGQRVLTKLKPMGGEPGDARASRFSLQVHGAIEAPFRLDFAGLLAEGPVTASLDVHCVTGWSVLGAKFTGVRIRELLEKAKLKASAKHVVFEAAHGYTANVRLAEALDPQNLVAFELDGQRLASAHGGPARAVVPSLYFWKSAKWLTGIRVTERDEPGYWEQRGYHNHADPWKEERYA